MAVTWAYDVYNVVDAFVQHDMFFSVIVLGIRRRDFAVRTKLARSICPDNGSGCFVLPLSKMVGCKPSMLSEARVCAVSSRINLSEHILFIIKA